MISRLLFLLLLLSADARADQADFPYLLKTFAPSELGLLNGIYQAGCDNLLRLIYADERQENGHEELAELVRLQVYADQQLADLEPDPVEVAAVEKRIRQLIPFHLEAGSKSALGQKLGRFGVGFPAYYLGMPIAQIESRVLLQSSQGLRQIARFPIINLELVVQREADLIDLMKRPNFRTLVSRLSGLKIRAEVPIEPDIIEQFFGDPAVGRLTYLWLEGISFLSEHHNALSKSRYLDNLRVLKIDSLYSFVEEPNRQGLVDLFNSPATTRLLKLSLSGYALHRSQMRQLVENPRFLNLRDLELRAAGLGDPGLVLLARSPNKLTRLRLPGNRIGARGAAALFRSSTGYRLTHLSLERNQIFGLPGERVRRARNFVDLNLSGNQIGVGISTLARWRMPYLRTLDISAVAAHDDQLVAISRAPFASSLWELNMKGNLISTDGLLRIKDANGLSALLRLRIPHPWDDLSGDSLIEFFDTTKLKYLRSVEVESMTTNPYPTYAAKLFELPLFKNLLIFDNHFIPDAAARFLYPMIRRRDAADTRTYLPSERISDFNHWWE